LIFFFFQLSTFNFQQIITYNPGTNLVAKFQAFTLLGSAICSAQFSTGPFPVIIA
jgi:hypothetical protein